jgi:LysM repeat protein
MKWRAVRFVWAVPLAVTVLTGCHNGFITIGPRPAPVEPIRRPTVEVDTTDWVGYRVQSGDTVARLARCSGASIEEVASANQVADPDQLRTGRAVLLPPGHHCLPPEPLPAVAAAPAPKKVKCEAPAAPARVLTRARRLLAEATQQQESADFAQALAAAQSCTKSLEPYVLDDEANVTRARCHAVAASAAAGLGRREHAIEEFRRAFAVDPTLELDPAAQSPRIQELVQAARR